MFHRGPILACALVGAALASATTIACSVSLCTETRTCATGAPVEDAPATDVADAAAAESSGPCDALDPTVAFCWDFSRDTRESPRDFREVASGLGSTIEVSTVRSSSPPRSGRVGVSASGVYAQRSAAFVRDGLPRGHVRFTSSVYIDELPSKGDLELNAVSFLDTPIAYRFAITLGTDGAALVESRDDWLNPYASTNVRTTPLRLSKPLGSKVWRSLAIEVSVVAPKFVRVTLDGVDVATQGVAYAVQAATRIEAGITRAGADVDKASVFVDDMKLEYLP